LKTDWQLKSFLILLTLLAGLTAPVWAEQADEDLYQGLEQSGQEQPRLTTRSPRPISKIAENVTVITAVDIARINAHTLADVLQTVPGIQLDQVQTPGALTFFSILSSFSRHILVTVDGVPQNLLSADLNANIGSLPVQMIERVEIIKGAASAAWGSALGGVVNVVTKSPDPERLVSGLASASAGERHTTDLRGELGGTAGRTGYYLTGGNLYSHGLTPGTPVNLNYGFAKLTYALPGQGLITAAADLRQNSYGLEDYLPADYHDTGSHSLVFGYLKWQQPLADSLSLESTLMAGRRKMGTKWGALSGPNLFKDDTVKEDFNGASLRLLWGEMERNLVIGAEYEHNAISEHDPVNPDIISNYNLNLDRLAGYLNGTWSIGPLAILPGIRVDHSNLFGDAFSATLGATVKISDATLLRIYTANGYSLPIVSNLAISNGSRELQKIWTVQPGFETTAIPYLWLKGSLFYNDISKIQQWDTSTTPAIATTKGQTRQGYELEAKTVTYNGFSFGGSYNYTRTRDNDSGETLKGDQSGVPQQGAKLAMVYQDNNLGLLGSLNGNYVWWDLPNDSNVKYSGMIWDLHLTQKLVPASALSPELFFSAHNLFNGTQYQSVIRPNAPRWFEGGVRFSF
jgi:vitamin B12 transporter